MKQSRVTKLKVSIGKASYQGERAVQEDSFYVAPMRVGKPWLGVVSDGMGGHQSGDVASQIGVQSVRDEFEKYIGKGISVKNALRTSVEHAHKAVVSKAESLRQLGDMGATIVAIAFDKNIVTWCTAGDSRLYLIRSGLITQLSRDFTLATDLEQAVKVGHVSRQEVDANPQKTALTSFLGAEKLRTDEGSIRVLGGDFFIACTDGIYGTTFESGLVAACSDVSQLEANPAEKAVDIIFNGFLFPLKKPKQDNATVIIVSIQEIDAKGNVIHNRDNEPRYKVGLKFLGIAFGALAVVAATATGFLMPAEWRPFGKNEIAAKPASPPVVKPTAKSSDDRRAPTPESASPQAPEAPETPETPETPKVPKVPNDGKQNDKGAKRPDVPPLVKEANSRKSATTKNISPQKTQERSTSPPHLANNKTPKEEKPVQNSTGRTEGDSTTRQSTSNLEDQGRNAETILNEGSTNAESAQVVQPHPAKVIPSTTVSTPAGVSSPPVSTETPKADKRLPPTNVNVPVTTVPNGGNGAPSVSTDTLQPNKRP